jgi:hypothetical protein
MALKWTFRSYVGQDGSDVIKDWYDSAESQTRGAFRSKLQYLGRIDKLQWRRPVFDTLSGDCDGLWEIRFEANGKPWRPLGFFQGTSTFTLVICATKNGRRWIPSNACSVGLNRKAEILHDAERCHDLPIPLE